MADHVARVAHPVDVADLVAVVRRDRHLGDALAGAVQLQDDLGVEVEAVGVGDERHVGEGIDAVGAVAGVPLAEREAAARGVLEAGEDAVADELVHRHAPGARLPAEQHARSEHRVGGAVEDRGEHLVHHLRRVLPVAVQQDDGVPAVLDRVAVAGLLVAAVAEVALVAHHGDRQPVGGGSGVPRGHTVGVVGGVVVLHEHLGQAVAHRRRDAVEHRGQRALGVVGHHEHPDLHPLDLAVPCSLRMPARSVVVATTARREAVTAAPRRPR